MNLLMPVIGQGRVVVRTRYGFEVEAYLNDSVYAPLLFDGDYEPRTSELISREISDADLFLDCGANYGYFTLLAASAGGPSLGIHAFEPQPSVFERLRQNVERCNFRVELHRLALGERPGKVKLMRPRRRASGNAYVDPAGGAESSLEVDVGVLDEIVPATSGKLVLKVDVEGYEWPVLKGARRLLREASRVVAVVELYPAHTARFGYQVADLLRWASEELGLKAAGQLDEGNMVLMRP